MPLALATDRLRKALQHVELLNAMPSSMLIWYLVRKSHGSVQIEWTNI